MPQKGRLPVEEKVRIVEAYLSGQIGKIELQTQCGITAQTLYDWIRLYKTRGIDGLAPATRTRKYPPELKCLAVEDYLSGGGSLSDICVKYDISDRKMLRDWIQCYNGHIDFKQPNSGGAIYMAKGRKTTLEERVEMVSHCIAHNKDYGKTIELYSVSYQQIYGWVRRYEESGSDGLVDRRGKRKDEMSMTEMEKLRAQLKLKEAENTRLTVNKKRVYRVMRAIGMKSVIRRKRPNYVKSKPEVTAENILNRNFAAEVLNEKWLSDITEFKTKDGNKLYLSAILDLKDKSIVFLYHRSQLLQQARV